MGFTRKNKSPLYNMDSIKDRMNRFFIKSPKMERFLETVMYYVKHPDEFNQKLTQLHNKAMDRNENLALPDFANKLKSAYRMVKMTMSGEYKGLSKSHVYVGIAVLLYVISPLDLIPDSIPVIGFVDDAALVLWLMKHTITEVEKFEQWEASLAFKPVSTLF